MGTTSLRLSDSSLGSPSAPALATALSVASHEKRHQFSMVKKLFDELEAVENDYYPVEGECKAFLSFDLC